MGVVSDRGASGRDDVLNELERLREENARLRSMLGLERDAGGHATAWSPMLVPEVAAPSVDNSSPNDSKLALLASLFGARADVYATRWENTVTGKSGWSPATTCGWARRRSARDCLPLTDDVFASH